MLVVIADQRFTVCRHRGATWYNFARIISAVRMSLAIAARLTETLWDIGDIVKMVEEASAS